MNKSGNIFAPQIHYFLELLSSSMLSPRDCTPETYEMLPELFAEVRKISPYYSNGVRKIFYRVNRGKIDDWMNFDEAVADEIVNNREEFEELWIAEYPTEKIWFQFSFYENDDYKSISINNRIVIQDMKNREDSPFGVDATLLIRWLIVMVKNCINEIDCGEYNQVIAKDLPPGFKYGTITRKNLWEVCPQEKADYFKDFPELEVQEFQLLMEETNEDSIPNRYLQKMTVQDFLYCCQLGYRANQYPMADELSPRELYKKYADGRYCGLLEIQENSPEVFEDWLEKHERGGHPWEICRGGNSTHISLYVCKNDQGFYFSIDGYSWTRSVESIKFYLAIRKAGFPIVIRYGKQLAARLSGSDEIGIVPDGVFPGYCEAYFTDKRIIDYINLPHENRESWSKYCEWVPEPELKIIK